MAVFPRKAGEGDGLDDDHTKCLTRFSAFYPQSHRRKPVTPGVVHVHISHCLAKQLSLERKSNEFFGSGKK